MSDVETGHLTEFWLRDPDGNALIVVQPLG